jgi:short-subunit dehydrogenase involved in D-alanine esterification of teichoic acids
MKFKGNTILITGDGSGMWRPPRVLFNGAAVRKIFLESGAHKN